MLTHIKPRPHCISFTFTQWHLHLQNKLTHTYKCFSQKPAPDKWISRTATVHPQCTPVQLHQFSPSVPTVYPQCTHSVPRVNPQCTPVLRCNPQCSPSVPTKGFPKGSKDLPKRIALDALRAALGSALLRCCTDLGAKLYFEENSASLDLLYSDSYLLWCR